MGCLAGEQDLGQLTAEQCSFWVLALKNSKQVFDQQMAESSEVVILSGVWF